MLPSAVRFLLSGDAGQRLRELVGAGAGRGQKRVAASADAAGAPPDASRRRALVVNAMDFPEAYVLLGQDPAELQRLLASAVEAAMQQLAPGADAAAPKARLAGVPAADFALPSVSRLRVADQRRFVRFSGTLTRAGAVKVVQEWRKFRCEQCGHEFELRASAANGYDFEVPSECGGGRKQPKWDPKVKAKKMVKCHSRAFQQLAPGEECMTDFQEVRVQDPMSVLEAGAVPKSVGVVLFGDLVGQAQPGDSVSVEGIVLQRWRPPWQGRRLEVELIVEATHVERLATNSPVHTLASDVRAGRREAFERFWKAHEGDEWRGRAALLRATAPWLSGMPVPKLALLLTLIGGAPPPAAAAAPAPDTGAAPEARWGRFLAQGQPASAGAAPRPGEACAARSGGGPAAEGAEAGKEHTRLTPHLLLLGDPGTGKSQLLQVAQELAGRTVRTSGLGCTNAGLTCAAVRDGPDFVLEAGALVLADGGVCCIDEFSTIRSHDRAAVHEAMEQQTVSVAKGGLVCRLRSRCSVVAAQNCRGGGARPRGRGGAYDRGASVSVNSGLPPPILSRFDLVVVFSEGGRGAATEEDKAESILDSAAARSAAGAEEQRERRVAAPAGEEADLGGGVAHCEWGHEQLREYLAWVRERPLEPEAADPRAAELIERYFQVLRAGAARGGGSASDGGVTVRTLESLVRLTQAHARLMCHRGVQFEDAVATLVLHRAALQDHVVDADLGGDAAECPEPSVPDPLGETPACEVSTSVFSGMQLHHGSDISNSSVYRHLEELVLRRLQKHLAPDGRLADGATGPLPLPPPEQPPAAPALGRVAVKEEPPSPRACSQAVSSQRECHASQPWVVHSQGAPTKPRGRCLGSRMR